MVARGGEGGTGNASLKGGRGTTGKASPPQKGQRGWMDIELKLVRRGREGGREGGREEVFFATPSCIYLHYTMS